MALENYMSRRNTRLGYIEWDSKGKICRIVKVQLLYEHLNVLDRMAKILADGLAFIQFDVDWCARDRMYYFHESARFHGRVYLNKMAGDHRCTFWSDTDIEFGKDSSSTTGRKLSEAQIKKMGYDRVDAMKWQDDITVGNSMYDRPPAAEGECYFCERCDDFLPEEDPCDHQFFCEDDLCEGLFQPTHSPDHNLCEHAPKKEPMKHDLTKSIGKHFSPPDGKSTWKMMDVLDGMVRLGGPDRRESICAVTIEEFQSWTKIKRPSWDKS